MAELPDTQRFVRPGMIEFGWGHPADELLPAAGLLRAAAEALGAGGAAALAYGAAQGPGQLIELLCERLGRIEGATPQPERLMITGGTSQALDMLCTLLTKPGEVALVQSPVYHLALRILRDHGLELLPVASDSDGLRLDALEDALVQLHRAGRRPSLLYSVPTFTNPTGVSLATERRAALAQLAARHDMLLLEDDVYRELWYDEPPPPPVASYDQAGRVVRLGSFAKVLAPGLRLGWMLGDPTLLGRCAGSGMLDSGGGVNHFTGHLVAEFLRLGLLDDHVAGLRQRYRARREALLAALARHLPAGCRYERPQGGFFVWLELPEGLSSDTLLPRAEQAGVSYIPGTRFHSDGGGQHNLRLAFSLLPPEELEQGAAILGRVIAEALYH